MPDRASIDSTLQTVARHPFRARFHLRGRELLVRRLAPAEPANDGRQTPWIETDLAASGSRAPR